MEPNMNPTTLRIAFVLFLIAHGWIHASLSQAPLPQPGGLHTPFLPAWWRDAVDPSWPISRMGVPAKTAQTAGWLLWLATTAGFALAGLALLLPGQAGLWQGLAAGAALLSLALLGLYWHPWLPVGVLIDLALLAGILLRWPGLRF